MKWRLLPAMIFTLFIPFFTHAQETKGLDVLSPTQSGKLAKGETYAIVVGISKYQGVKPLRYADEDALLFAEFLQSTAGGNVKKENIRLLINDSAKAADFNQRAYAWLKKKELQVGDRLFIYFSGHGDAINEDKYFLLPFDCFPQGDDNNYLGTGNIDMHTVKTLFIKPNVKKGVEVFLIVDACRSHDMGDKNYQSIAVQREGEVIMLSCSADQVSWEDASIGGGHGLFTYYLIDALSGAAKNRNGVIRVKEVSEYLTQIVGRKSDSLFKTEQWPVFLPEDKMATPLAVYDSIYYQAWVASHTVYNTRLALNTGKNRKAVDAGDMDTGLISLYNSFNSQLKSEKFIGDNSAEYFYGRMIKQAPQSTMTDDAKYALATEMINFAQDKINQYLSGKSDNRLRDEASRHKSGSLSKKSSHLSQVANTSFKEAAVLLSKAIILYSDEPEITGQLYAKLYFLQAKAIHKKYIGDLSSAEANMGISLVKQAIALDTTAAYNYLLLASFLHGIEKHDSSLSYIQKAISLAPRWAYALNFMGHFFKEKKDYRSAIKCYADALKIDSLNPFFYNSIGNVYLDLLYNRDSAEKYYNKALQLDPGEFISYSNLGILYSRLIKGADMPSNKRYFGISANYYYRSVALDPLFIPSYCRLAELYLEKSVENDRYDSAEKWLMKAIEMDTNSIEAYEKLGDVYEAKKEYERGEQCLRKAIAIDTNNSSSWNYIGYFFYNRKQYDSAIKYFLVAIAHDTGNIQPLKNIGDVYSNLKKFSVARQYYSQALAINSDDVDLLNAIGVVFEITKQYDSAMKYYIKAATADTTSVIAVRYIADIYFVKKQDSLAEKYYRRSIIMDTTRSDSWTALGRFFKDIGQIDSSVKYCFRALGKDSTNSVAWQFLGHSAMVRSNFSNAEVYYKKAIQFDSANPTFRTDLAYNYSYDNKLEKANLIYDELLLKSPHNIEYLDAKCQGYIAANNYKDAEVWSKKIIDIDSVSTGYLETYAFINLELKQYDIAEKYYRKLLEVDSLYQLGWIRMGGIYNAKGKTDSAEYFYLHAVKLDSSLFFASLRLGNFYRDIKNYDAAIKVYNKLIKMDSTFYRVYIDLGYSYLQQKKYELSERHFKRALSLNTGKPDPYYELCCYYSVRQDAANGLKCLEKVFALGYKEYEELQQDKNMAYIISLPEYNVLLKKYFGSKVKK